MGAMEDSRSEPFKFSAAATVRLHWLPGVTSLCVHQVPALQAAVLGDQLKQDFTVHAKGGYSLRESQVLVTLSWLRFCPVLESGPFWGTTEAPPSGHHT